MDAINVTISLYFEIKDSYVYGGAGTIGYSEIKADLIAEKFSKIDLEMFAENQICGIAEFCKVPDGNVRVISRSEYEQNTEDD